MGTREIFDKLRYQINKISGFDIVHFSGQHTLRSHIVKVINLYDVDTIIDVGANEGQFAESIRKLGFNGTIISFEPVNIAFEKLEISSATDKSWSCFNFALGSESGETRINVSKFTSMSSILKANDYGKGNWENMELTHSQKTEIRTLDECQKNGMIPGTGRFLLKMDTQGYDREVFLGARTLISDVRCMLSELSLIPLYHGMSDYKESLSAYESQGFSVSGMYPITRNQNLSLNEMDCMLVNPKFLKKSR